MYPTYICVIWIDLDFFLLSLLMVDGLGVAAAVKSVQQCASCEAKLTRTTSIGSSSERSMQGRLRTAQCTAQHTQHSTVHSTLLNVPPLHEESCCALM